MWEKFMMQLKSELSNTRQNIQFLDRNCFSKARSIVVSKQDKIHQYSYGVAAEKLIIAYLKQNGSVILGHRYKSPYGEIDIVAYNRQLQQIVFVEVKARRNKTSGRLHLDGIITSKQQNRYLEAIEWFRGENLEYAKLGMRIDLALVLNGQLAEYIENCWQ